MPDPSLAPRGRDPPWLSLVSQKTEAASPRQALDHVPASRSSKASPRPWPSAGRQWGVLPGAGEATAVGPGSFLVVIGGVREDKLEAVGLGQQQADVFVAPVGCGQVLEEEQQLLGGERQPGSDGAASCVGVGAPAGGALRKRTGPRRGEPGGRPAPENHVPSQLEPEGPTPCSQEEAPREAPRPAGTRRAAPAARHSRAARTPPASRHSGAQGHPGRDAQSPATGGPSGLRPRSQAWAQVLAVLPPGWWASR